MVARASLRGQRYSLQQQTEMVTASRLELPPPTSEINLSVHDQEALWMECFPIFFKKKRSCILSLIVFQQYEQSRHYRSSCSFAVGHGLPIVYLDLCSTVVEQNEASGRPLSLPVPRGRLSFQGTNTFPFTSSFVDSRWGVVLSILCFCLFEARGAPDNRLLP